MYRSHNAPPPIMSSGKDFTVAIVGGGLVGVLCAIGLGRAGIQTDIFEAAVCTFIHFLRILLTSAFSTSTTISAQGLESV